MSEPKLCCQELPKLPRSGSPFDQFIALGYYDGPTDGFLHCGGCGREFFFRLLDQREDSTDELEMRVYGLAPLPVGTIALFTEAIAPYQKPQGPLWAPIWSFPSDEIRDQMNATAEGLESSAGTVELVIASSGWLDGEIIAARSIPPSMELEGTDWFAFLGLITLEVPG